MALDACYAVAKGMLAPTSRDRLFNLLTALGPVECGVDESRDAVGSRGEVYALQTARDRGVGDSGNHRDDGDDDYELKERYAGPASFSS